MIGRIVCLALVCLALSVNGEAPQSPWQTLTPTAKPVKHAFDQGQAIAQLALHMEEEILVEMLPFKPPFKMDKKQMAVIIKLLKKGVKPILKSERLLTMISTVDDFIQDLESNQENKKYYAGMLNAAQDVYRELKRMYNAEQTDEGQARTWDSVSSIYQSSVLRNWIVSPFTNWVITPITSRLSSVVDRVSNLIPNNSWVIDTEYINPFESLGETFQYYVNRMSSWSSRARHTLEATARLLEEQDAIAAARSCSGGCGSNSVSIDNGDTDVQVTELTWVIPVVATIAVAALVAAAGGIAAAIAIPLGIVGGLGGFGGPAITGPVLTGIPVTGFTGPVLTGVPITGTATNFGQGAIGRRQDSYYAYDRPEHIRQLVDNFDVSVLDDSDWAGSPVQYSSYSSSDHKGSTT
ncbi:unnamed protein product [Meganyctiphanes norvegica]|uniref:Uncharacterized protein n=1 Tax=Meganyctiphanes norvegica TaxID=48144 RepID=A0AAV2Q5C9_MEGNR